MKQNVRINIGGYYASAKPAIIHTILGSCVSSCIYDPIKRIGGMNHILLPGYVALNVMDGSARYGVNAMELLINAIIGLGGSRKNLVAKVFGGSNVVDVLKKEDSVGMQNTKFMFEYLKKDGITVAYHDTGGEETRVIDFHTDTGEVFLKRIRRDTIPKLVQKERKAIKKLGRQVQGAGKIDLF